MDLSQLEQWRDELYELPPSARQELLAHIRVLSPAAAAELGKDLEHLACLEEDTRTQTQAEQVFREQDWAGTVIGGRYEILHFLGEGGSARVFVARQTNVCNREVVVKILRPSHGAFRDRELEALVRLPRHAGVVSVLDAGVDRGLHYLVTERLSGECLADVLQRGPLEWRHAVQITAQVADALQALHTNGVYHRDVKPANIILIDNGQQAVLIDFGIAHLSERSLTYTMAAGTPRYMAPEQFLDHQVSPRTDVFALGVLLMDMLMGPRRESEPATVSARLQQSMLPPHLRTAVLRACEIDPCKRHATPAEFIAELQASPGRLSRRWIWSAGVAVGVAGALGLAGVYGLSAPLSVLVEPDPRSSLTRMRFLMRLTEDLFIYIFSGVESSASVALTLLWPKSGGSGRLSAGEHAVPPQSWNWFTLEREHPPHTVWLAWSRHVDPSLAMHTATDIIPASLAPAVRAYLRSQAVAEVPVRFPAQRIRLQKPGVVCFQFPVPSVVAPS